MEEVIQQLAQEVINLGRDDRERARVLGVSQRTITDYKAGRFPRIITSLLEQRIIVLRVPIVTGRTLPKRNSKANSTQAGEGAAGAAMSTYTVLDLAALRALSRLDAAAELICLPRAELALICQRLGLMTLRRASASGLVAVILRYTHPLQAQAAPAGESSSSQSSQMGMF
jgi:hypothetical protein